MLAPIVPLLLAAFLIVAVVFWAANGLHFGRAVGVRVEWVSHKTSQLKAIFCDVRRSVGKDIAVSSPSPEINSGFPLAINDGPNEMGVPPALPGRQSNFENSGSIPPAVAFVFAEARCLASLVPLQLLLLFTGCDQAPLRGQQP